MLIDVKSIVLKKKKELKERVDILRSVGNNPKLAVIVANEDMASNIYVSKKREMCKEVGVEEIEFVYDKNVTTDKIISKINELNNDDTIHGILVQLPLFKHLDEVKVLESISPFKDADGLHINNIGKVATGNPYLIPCTPKGIMTVLDEIETEYEGKNAVIVGRSNLVGKPMAELLCMRNATVTLCHSKTKDLKEYTKNADILIVAVGKEKLITEDMVKEGSTIIDVGINRNEFNKVVGDCDTLNIKDKVKYLTPVPGGIGLTTVISLLENVVYIASKCR